jgi:divalent metal cation (Fe/Co/Zn/Cd) transporter
LKKAISNELRAVVNFSVLPSSIVHLDEQQTRLSIIAAMHSSSPPANSAVIAERNALVARGRRLEYLTIAWNGFEAAVALIAGFVAGSVALLGFGLDSVIETTSAGILLWRLRSDHQPTQRERTEHVARKLVGACFLLLAAYVTLESAHALWTRERSERSIAGILIAIAAAIVMPLLGRAKRRVAAELGSRALHSDSRQADFCAYLSAILLAGLLLNAGFGWWWADPIAALVMVPIIAREGVQGLRGEACDDCGGAH